MSARSAVVDQPREFADDYAAALEGYLAAPDELALANAYALGRAALDKGRGLLDMASIHSRALANVLTLYPDDHLRILEASETFLADALSPFEMAHRGFRETNGVLQRLNDVLEGQAKRIASLLHDEAAQLLVPTHLALAEVAKRLPSDAAEEILAARRLLDQMEVRLRNIAHELRPPILDELGLVPALEFLVDSVSKRSGLSVTLAASLHRHLPATVETTLYRIVQEALTNVTKHANAASARVSVRHTARRITVSVSDDGVGIGETSPAGKKDSRGLGLVGIQERATALGGTFHVRRSDEGGTSLSVEIPLER